MASAVFKNKNWTVRFHFDILSLKRRGWICSWKRGRISCGPLDVVWYKIQKLVVFYFSYSRKIK